MNFPRLMVLLVAGLSLAAILLPLHTQARSGKNLYPFDNKEDYLSQAGDFESWANTLARHREQRSLLLGCTAESKRCRGRLRSFNRMLDKARDLGPEEKVELVNFYINRTKYDKDHPQRLFDEQGNKIGVLRNHWATLYEFLTDRGDCEDYASAKYFMLRELGFDAQAMRVVVIHETRPRGYHAVLAIRLDKDTVWLLESDNVIKKRYHGYRYVYAMNEHAVWDHRDDF